MKQLTPAKIAEVCERFDGLSPHYRQSLHSALRAILRSIGAPIGCAAGIPRMAGSQPRETTVTATDFEQTYRQAGPALQVALLLARDAALRSGTILKLTLEQVDFERNLIQGVTKGGRRFTTPMTHRLRERLLWIAPGCEGPQGNLLAATRFNRQPYSIDAMHHQLKDAQARAGVSTSWTFHDLRRTTARDVYAATHDIRKVQRLLSHVNLRTTLWYIGNAAIDLSGSEIEQAINRNPSTGEQRNEAVE